MFPNEPTARLLAELVAADVEMIVVGGAAAVLQAVPIVTQDIDVVHRRTPENVDRLLGVLKKIDAYFRFDLANRRLLPSRDLLMGSGHLNLMTSFGPLDILCELMPGQGYDEVLADTTVVTIRDLSIRVLGLPRLIQVKAAAGRPKDRVAIPILVAALEEQRKLKP
jgi:hypothetical protein